MTPDASSSITAECSEEEATPVIRLAGALDLTSVETALAALDGVVDAGGEGLIFDLADVTFMDSSGIAFLLTALARFGRVRLRRPTPPIRRVIEMTGLADSLPVEMRSEQSFEPVPASVPTARQFITRAAAGLPDSVVERAVLIVSEMATNAVLHARTDFSIELELLSSVLRIEIRDHGEGEPELQPPQPPTALHGRGLQIVDHLADRWGILSSKTGLGKVLWVEVGLDGLSG